MFVVGRRVVDVKEVRELSPDVDIGSSDSQNKAQEVNTHLMCVVCIGSVFRESTPVLVLYQIQ